MKTLASALLIACALAGQGLADISSVRPMPRPSLAIGGDVQILPQSQVAAVEYNLTSGGSIRPMPRPDIRQAAVQAKRKGFFGKLFAPKNAVAKERSTPAPKQYNSGSICNDSAIQGTAIPTIRGAQAGCGVDNPVRVTAVDGVTLSMPATIDCNTARALRKWVTNKVKPAFGRNEVTGIHVAAHYACRSRNNKKGARISEHGRGKAIDISGFTLANGSEISVLNDFKSNRGKAMRRAHKGACGIFGTTLGPGSDGYHEDHMHFDTAKYRGGPYCK